MNRRKIRNELLNNMNKLIDIVRQEKQIKENIWITKVRINLEYNLLYIQYEGDTRVGCLIYDYTDDIQEANLIKNYGDKSIIGFRFRKLENYVD